MKYYFEKPEVYTTLYGKLYRCDHPLYSRCTLYLEGNFGLAVVQQRFDRVAKRTYWTEIDPWLIDAIYLHPGFKEYFDQKGDYPTNGFWPAVTVRQIMWALKMKPLKKEPWETVFDHSPI